MIQRFGQTGTTLVEVLVALLVFSIGLLGMSGLQTVSVRNTQSAYLRSQATVMSIDILERMRANAQGLRAGSYHNIMGIMTSSCLMPGGCSADAMASHDVAEWRAHLAATLPSGDGIVCIDSTPADGTPADGACDGIGETYAVKLWWDQNRDSSVNHRYVVNVQL